MAIELACPKCHKRLKAPLGAEGKRFKCPHCHEVVIVPGGAAPTNDTANEPLNGGSAVSAVAVGGSSNVAPLDASKGHANAAAPAAERAERWYVKTRAGVNYGPVSRDELDRWVGEERLDVESQILREGANRWQWASDLYPQLNPTAPASSSKPAPNGSPSVSPTAARPIDVTAQFDISALSPQPEPSFEQPAVAQSAVAPSGANAPANPAAAPTEISTSTTSAAIVSPTRAPAELPPEPSVPLPTSEPTRSGKQHFAAGSYVAPRSYSLSALPSEKSKAVAGVLGLLVGAFGVHRFYLGYANIAVVQILVTLATCGLGAWWGFVEGCMILVGRIDRDAQGRKLVD